MHFIHSSLNLVKFWRSIAAIALINMMAELTLAKEKYEERAPKLARTLWEPPLPMNTSLSLYMMAGPRISTRSSRPQGMVRESEDDLSPGQVGWNRVVCDCGTHWPNLWWACWGLHDMENSTAQLFGYNQKKSRVSGHAARKLAKSAYPEARAQMQDRLVKEQFVQGIMDHKLHSENNSFYSFEMTT